MKRASLLLVFALTMPALAQTKLDVPYTQFRLPNGLTVILHEDHSVPLVTVNMWYHVGSARERTGRTGFAHLFEHLMFMGSGHVKPGEFDSWLESTGGDNNGSTQNDRTNYWINVPANALELALFLESDRMGYLEDLTAASYEDVVAFFKKYYTPSNASLVVAGDIDAAAARRAVEKWFSDVKAGPLPDPMPIPAATLTAVKTKTVGDKVQLPRLYLGWLTPRHLAPGDATLDVVADVLAGGKNSRLYKRLVYDMQIAQDVSAFQASAALSSSFMVIATARPGHTAAELQKVIDAEIKKLQSEPPSAHELERSLNQIESSFYNRIERVGGFGGKADQLNSYYTETGDADWFNEDLARYRALSASDIRAAAAEFLPLDKRVELTVEPEKRP